ncbi:hypothetical protein CK203_052664 [Vitis vinifera]|uniref:Uncharacterized protein n=1 Tax=Vitis vinifera TaxID=29760 RepID=A0A438GHC6_VITVI|nr:hypothetical protein CK203_052664 [Vitis vinifera]
MLPTSCSCTRELHIHSYPPFFLLIFLPFSHSSKHQKKTSTKIAAGDAQNSNSTSSLTPKLQNPSNGEPRMQFWEHEALLRRSDESHAPRILRRLLQELGGSGIVDDARGELSPRRPGSTEEAPHAPIKAAAASPTLRHRHQAAAAGSTSGCRHWNMTTNTAYAAAIEAARRVGSLDQLRRPPAMPLSPPFPPSSSPEVKKKSM